MRKALAHVSRRQHQIVAAVMRTAFVQENHRDARYHWRETADKLSGRFSEARRVMDDPEDDVLAFMPACHNQHPGDGTPTSIRRMLPNPVWQQLSKILTDQPFSVPEQNLNQLNLKIIILLAQIVRSALPPYQG